MLSPGGQVEYLKAASVTYPTKWRGSPDIDVVTVRPAKAKGPVERSFHWMLGGSMLLMLPLALMSTQVRSVDGQLVAEDMAAMQPYADPFVFAMFAWIAGCIVAGMVFEARNTEALRREQRRAER